MNFKNSIIGKEMWPIDNSNQCNILSGKPSALAGDFYGAKPKRVKIVSGPYKLTYFNSAAQEETSEFVTVLCEGELYVCSNKFNETEKEAMDRYEKFLLQCQSIAV